jgi:RimJ/RimL family protein N-acetyltransferase
MKYFRKMTGEKCYLSPINADDVLIYTKWMNDLDVTKNLGNYRYNFSIAGEKEALEKLAKDHNYAIIDVLKDEVIGNCGFFKLDHLERNAECGIFIGNKEYWNKGYGTEALTLLLSYGFDYLNLRNVMLKVFSFNERAIASYKKIGFKEIGKRRKTVVMNGVEYDDIYMDILDEEFRNLKK